MVYKQLIDDKDTMRDLWVVHESVTNGAATLFGKFPDWFVVKVRFVADVDAPWFSLWEMAGFLGDYQNLCCNSQVRFVKGLLLISDLLRTDGSIDRIFGDGFHERCTVHFFLASSVWWSCNTVKALYCIAFVGSG